jgi:dTDP-4-dehydrorhamnose reductase
MTSSILIVGSSGNVGRQVCLFLDIAGVAYTKTTRHKNQVASDTRFLDFYVPESFVEALQSIQTLFAVRDYAVWECRPREF